MYEYLKGRLAGKNPAQAVVDVGGVGYRVTIPISTYEALPDLDEQVQLLIHVHVREDALRLYGFATEPERYMFEMLTGISGIGAGLALTILSGIPTADLAKAISEQNTALLQSVKGIGKKTAQRVVLELRDKIGPQVPGMAMPVGGVAADAVAALASLNVPRAAAERAVAAAMDALGAGASVEDVVRAALQQV